MTAQELAYTEIERLVKNFKEMPAAQRKGLNEMRTRLGINRIRLEGSNVSIKH